MPVYRVKQRQMTEDIFEFEVKNEAILRDHFAARGCFPSHECCELHFPMKLGRCLTDFNNRTEQPIEIVSVEKISDGTLDELFAKEEQNAHS